MKPAAFTLENVFYPQISVRANREHNYDGDGDPVLPSIKIHSYRGDGGRYQIALDLKKAIESDADAYEVKALAIGVFQTDPATPEDKQQAIVMRSGPQIVYGALRDHIATITARGPWNEYYLPAIIIDQDDFVFDDEDEQDLI